MSHHYDANADPMSLAVVKLTDALLEELGRARALELSVRVEQASARSAWSRLEQLQRDVGLIVKVTAEEMARTDDAITLKKIADNFIAKLDELFTNAVER